MFRQENMSINTKQTSFLIYYRQYKNNVYNYFYYRVDFNRSIAEDLTSEVFIKALASFDNFDQTRSFQAWIYRIAHNHLANYYRTVNREVDLTDVYPLTDNYPKKLEVSLELERIIKLIRDLEPYYREVLLLRYVDELDNNEIAEVLEKDEGAVRTQVSRALALLREELKGYE